MSSTSSFHFSRTPSLLLLHNIYFEGSDVSIHTMLLLCTTQTYLNSVCLKCFALAFFKSFFENCRAQLPSCSYPIHPGSPLLPFSKICQVLFDADPLPVKVRFLLFQGSRLQNLTPSAFSCFLSKRKCCYASGFFFFFNFPPLPHLLSGTNLEQGL